MMEQSMSAWPKIELRALFLSPTRIVWQEAIVVATYLCHSRATVGPPIHISSKPFV